MENKIFTEIEAREWFKKFGQEDQTFDEIFGDEDLSKKSQSTIVKVANGTMFIKVKYVSVGYLIIPQSYI